MNKYLAFFFGLLIAGVGVMKLNAAHTDAWYFLGLGIVLVFLSLLPPGGRRVR
jgi:hypothetical protein